MILICYLNQIFRMKIKTLLLASLFCITIEISWAQNSESQDSRSISLSKSELGEIMEDYLALYNKVFGKGSTVEGVDSLYSFYTADFEYNHPKYGGVYSRDLLYNNTIKYLKKGSYENSSRRNLLNMIIGLDAVVIEQQYEDKEEATMTLFKFRNNKMYYIEEFW